MNDKWREEVIALATIVGEEAAQKAPMTIDEFEKWVHEQNAHELEKKLGL